MQVNLMKKLWKVPATAVKKVGIKWLLWSADKAFTKASQKLTKSRRRR
jgi:hypothetical protein